MTRPRQRASPVVGGGGSVSAPSRPRGFTMVELLVVIAIIALLVGLVIGIGGWAVEQGRQRDTAGLLKHLDDAIEQFRADAPLSRVPAFMNRYGGYPPDELEPFDKDTGIPGTTPLVCISPDSNAKVISPGPENADVKALALAIRLFGSEEAQQILERIDPRFRRSPELGLDGKPLAYWDRDGDGTFDAGDEPLDWFVDSWGTAIEYFDTRDPEDDAASGSREEFSDWVVPLNKLRPVLCSYGPDGPDQFSNDFRSLPPPEGALNLVEDYADDGSINNRFNTDNVYSTEGFAEKLRTGN